MTGDPAAEMLALLAELADLGVPLDVASDAIRMVEKPGRLAEARDLCLEALDLPDPGRLAAAEALVMRAEAAVREMVSRESAVARDPFPLLEEARDPRDLPTVAEWLRAGGPMREIPEREET